LIYNVLAHFTHFRVVLKSVLKEYGVQSTIKKFIKNIGYNFFVPVLRKLVLQHQGYNPNTFITCTALI